MRKKKKSRSLNEYGIVYWFSRLIILDMSPLITWPAHEKPREKLLHQGAEALSNAELLAILLGCGSVHRDVVSLARDLLTYYQTLHALFQADYESLSQHTGIGMAKFTQIKAVAELNRRYLQEPLVENTQCFIECDAVKKYLISELRGHNQEVFACLFLNSQFRLIRFEKLFTGTVDTTTVHPREVAKRALELNATAVIVAHNHPSGNVKASDADKNLTTHLVHALALIDVNLIDHIIVAGHQTFSFSEAGHL